jgi:hypothetical protein
LFDHLFQAVFEVLSVNGPADCQQEFACKRVL